jgi:hypothetical protein
MTSARLLVLAATLVLAAVAGCSGDDAGGSEDSDGEDVSVVVGGGGSTGSLPGYVTDLDAEQGTVVLSAVADRRPVLWTVRDAGDVGTTELGGVGYPQSVALAPDGTAYVLSDSGEIYRVQNGKTTMVVGDAPVGGEPGDPTDPSLGVVDRDGVYHEAGRVSAMTVDDQGRLVWTAVLSVPRDPGQSKKLDSLIVVRRMDGQDVELAAGSDTSPQMSAGDVYAQQEDPGSGTPAVGFPMLVPGPTLDLAADGNDLYLLAAGYVLRVDDKGTLSTALGGKGRDVPDAPFESEGSALDHGFTTDPDQVSASDGAFGVLDTSLAGEQSGGDAFDWTGAFTDGQQQVVDQVRRTEDGAGRGDFGNVVLLVRDGEASTAVAHVNGFALDGDTVYVVGQAGELGDDANEQQAILLEVSLPY